MVVPVVSLALVLREWKAIGWSAKGSWWGLVLIVLAALGARMQQVVLLLLVASPSWSTTLPPLSLVVLIYGVGAVVLLGGWRLFRAALFPILLLWFVNPIPHAFTLYVDVPLQKISAEVARAFSRELGHSLTPDNLRLMFTPQFGMFIAPGCNGIRGSVTMGFLALITGYLYRFRWYQTAAVTTGGVLLGYIFNLLRLCALVVYYVVALHFPRMQNWGEGADYAIGASLFLAATLLLFAAIHQLRPVPDDRRLAVSSNSVPASGYAHLVAMGLIVLAGWGSYAARATTAHFALSRNSIIAPLPETIGDYKLVRSWNETFVEGPVAYYWGEYRPNGGGTTVSLGISPTLGWHDALLCHSIRGEVPVWRGALTLSTLNSVPVEFGAALYNNGVSQYLELSTQCFAGRCGEAATERTHMGFVYSRPDPAAGFGAARPVPILLRAETTDITLSYMGVREQLLRDLKSFVSGIRLDELARSSAVRTE